MLSETGFMGARCEYGGESYRNPVSILSFIAVFVGKFHGISLQGFHCGVKSYISQVKAL